MSLQERTLISVVTPCYNEEENVNECHEAIRETFERDLPGYDFEHIFCDNDSRDRTVDVLRGIAARDGRVKVVVNSRNFGLFPSMFNGLMHTRGDAVVVLFPADLQDPADLIPRFVARWREGFEVVYGVKETREEGLLLRTARRAYYRLVSRFAEIDIPVDVSEFQLVDRRVVDALRRFDDYYPYLRGMIAGCGFRSTGIPYTWAARKRGVTKHNLPRLVDQGLNGLISSSKLPMRLCMGLGLVLAALSAGWGSVKLVVDLVDSGGAPAPGIGSLIVAVVFFAGVQMFFVGVLGEYVAAIQFQVRKRPLVVERELINFDLD